MKKVLSTLAVLATVAGSVVAFDEDNTRLDAATEAVTEVAASEEVAMPKQPVRTVAMSDDDFAAEQQDYTEFYDELAHLAQADVPNLEGNITVE